MSYWVLPESGIPISTLTVQRVPGLTRQTDEWKAEVTHFEQELERKWNATTSNLDLTGIQQGKLFDLELEEEEFIDDYRRVIDSELEPHMEDSVEAGSYVGMELGIRRGAESELETARVKRRVVGCRTQQPFIGLTPIRGPVR
jgi:hypothetical protein